MSEPCCMIEPQLCQKQLCRVNVFSSSVGSGTQGVELSHSKMVTLKWSVCAFVIASEPLHLPPKGDLTFSPSI